MTAPIWFRPTWNYFRYPKTISLKEQFEFTTQFIREVESLCKPDAYNLVAYKHLGDVFYFLGLRKVFEDYFNAPLHYIILPEHEFLTKIWGIDNYTTFPITNLVKKNKNFVTAFFDTPNPRPVDLDLSLENPYLMAAFGSIPQKGRPFVVENFFNPFHDFPYYWCFRWASNLGIEQEFRYPIPKGDIPLSKHAQRVVRQLGGINNIILVAPEAKTAIELPPEWWVRICQVFLKKGYSVIVNSKRIEIPNTYSTFDLDLSLEEVVSVGLKCHAVFALRSGLADVLVSAGTRLHVISPAMLRREQYSFEIPFEKPTGVNELQIYNWEVSDCFFEEVDIAAILRPCIKKCRNTCYKDWVLSLFSKSHKFWYGVHRDIAGRPKFFPENNVMNPPPETINVSLGCLNLYKRSVSNGFKQRSLLNGLIDIKRYQEGERVKVLGVAVYSRKEHYCRVTKVFGIPIHKKDRSKEFFNYLKESLTRAAKEVYGEGIVPDHVFIVRHNIGETLLYLAEYKRWVKAVRAEHPIFVVWRRRDIPLVKLFLGDCDSVRYFEISQGDLNRFLKDDLTDLDGIQIHTPTFEIAESMKAQYAENPNINFADCILSSMSLKSWERPVLPKPSQAAEKRATWLLNHKKVTKPFVLICPEAVSIKPIGHGFWSAVVDHFIKAGYVVLVNYYNQDQRLEPLEHLKTVSPDIDVLFAIAKRAERIISMASGMGVLLSLSGRPVDLIYTGFNNSKIAYTAEFCRKVYSVHHMPWQEVESTIEYLAEDVDELLSAIKARKVASCLIEN